MRMIRAMLAPFRGLVASMALFVVFAGVTVVKVYHASSTRRQALAVPPAVPSAAPGSAAKAVQAKTISEEFGQKFANFVLPPEPAKKEEPGPPPIPDDVKKQFVNPSTPISLFPPEVAPAKPPPAVRPIYYLPSFRVIRCELIAGPETGNMETPLIGVVVENQYAIDPYGVTRLVIPAGVEVHGVGKPSPVRDRIDGGGVWTMVWRTNDENNAMELTVNALALNRDYDPTTRVYGDAEKSPGILGRRFESVGDKLIQSALLASAAALTRDLKTSTAVLNPLTSQVVNQAKPTVGNALLEAGAAGTDVIARELDAIRKEIDEKGYYVAILPGKEFYLYTKEPIDLRNARRPQTSGLGVKPVANSGPLAPREALMRMFPETNLKPAATP